MGLSDYKTYKKRKKLLSFLKEEFGVSEQDLKDIQDIGNDIAHIKKALGDAHDDIEMLREQSKALAEKNSALEKKIEVLEKALVKTNELTAKQKEEIKKKYESVTTPEDIVKMFADDAEEFYPNGIGN